MKLFSKKRKKKKLGLIFDIGSGSVGGAVVELGEEKAKIIYAKRKNLKIPFEVSVSELENKIMKLLEEISYSLLKEGLKTLHLIDRDHKDLDFCHIFLSSPWYASNIEILKINKSESFKISKDLLNKTIKNEEEDFENSGENNLVFEKKITGLKLNGYKSQNPYGKEAHSVEMTLFMAATGSKFLDRIKDLVQKDFSLDKIKFHSFTSAFFSTVRDLYQEIKDFILIDITTEVTDITLCKGGVIYDNASFPKGQNFLLRNLAIEMNTTPRESLSALKSYLEGSEKLNGGKIEKVLLNAKQEFLRNFSTTLSELGDTLSVPRHVFLTIDEGLDNWFISVISEEEFIQGGIAGNPFIIKSINQGMLSPHLSKVRGINRDIFLSLESIFINKIFELER